jgi:hypothetical protein
MDSLSLLLIFPNTMILPDHKSNIFWTITQVTHIDYQAYQYESNPKKVIKLAWHTCIKFFWMWTKRILERTNKKKLIVDECENMNI